MTDPKEICRLEYLYGTLATAYKGVITSLAAKDFCMIEKNDTVSLKGTILAMPQGYYDSRLMHEGKELSRCNLTDGSFEFSISAVSVRNAKNLQIDIVQKGRHVGTFLLKRERPDEFYTSAVELSDELKDLAPHRLVGLVHDKPGLLRKAEEIISAILSPKRDWRKLSEDMNSFSRDLYWANKSAFSQWYPVFVQWSARACAGLSGEPASRAVSNLLSLGELTLDGIIGQEGSSEINFWLQALSSCKVDLALRLHNSLTTLRRINDRFPDSDIGPAIKDLLRSLRSHISKSPVFDDAVIDKLKGVVSDNDLMVMENCSFGNRLKTMAFMDSVDIMIDRRRYEDIFRNIKETASLLLDDTGMIEDLYALMERNLKSLPAGILTDISGAVFRTFPQLSSDALRKAFLNTASLLKHILALNMTELTESILTEIDLCSPEAKEGILLDPEVASSVITQGNTGLVRRYASIIKQIYVPSPRVSGFSNETWAEITDPRHTERLSKLLGVLGAGRGRFEDISIRLLCNLYVSGVLIPDDKLFQRDISAYLNSGAVKDDFLISYMLLKKLPVYFNEVGATSTLRDDTTEIDSWADDMVLYFLRKQIHVNSSNNNIRLVTEIIRSWVFEDRRLLKDVLPSDVYDNVNAGLMASYCIAIKKLFVTHGVLDDDGLHLDRLLLLPFTEIEPTSESIPQFDDGRSYEIDRKVFLICRIYREIVNKYELTSAKAADEDHISLLSGDIEKIRGFKQVIKAPAKTDPEENLYFKRHIAFGIPSVLGTYHEAKFDALADMFRTENGMVLIFEKMISETERMNTDPAPADFLRWTECLGAMYELMKMHAMDNFHIAEVLEIMKTAPLHVSQYADLLKVWQKELTWMVYSLTRRIHAHLMQILKVFPRSEASEHLRRLDTGTDDYMDRAADVIIRSIMSSIAGFTEMDRFIEILVMKSRHLIDNRKDLLLRMPESRADVSCPYSLALDQLGEIGAMRFAPSIGSKAKNLVYLLENRLPVPHGVVFSAEKTRDHLAYVDDAAFMNELKRAVNMIEVRSGLKFGDLRNPLFISVRSGSYISMPGILSSILYCGMNLETRNAFASASGNARLSWDSYRRFIYHYATVVFGLQENIFADIDSGFFRNKAASSFDDLNESDLAAIVKLHKDELLRTGHAIPNDPYEQLRESIKAVYGSWYGEKALHFRAAMKISDHWGTAVLLMQMIPGNRRGSGASVFFTRNPSSLEKEVYGDTRETATGDDLVYGRLINRPISKSQALKGIQSLEEIDPELYGMHGKLASDIEKAMGGLPQEVEATYITDVDGKRKIYVLQTRRMEFHRGFVKHFRDICMMDSSIIGRGVGVHGGALSGTVTFSSSADKIDSIKKETRLPVILLRESSSTNDVSLMPHIDGIITSTGGVTSHAAVLAQKFGLNAVVGCSDMEIGVDAGGESFARIGNYLATEGTMISVDGSTGLVYSGTCEFTTETKQ